MQQHIPTYIQMARAALTHAHRGIRPCMPCLEINCSVCSTVIFPTIEVDRLFQENEWRTWNSNFPISKWQETQKWKDKGVIIVGLVSLGPNCGSAHFLIWKGDNVAV